MKTILLVDDEQQTITVFQAALSAAGYNVEITQSAKHGLEMAKAKHYDLIILDEIMPDMSGNEATKILKGDPATSSIPIMILTNYGEGDLIKDAIVAGASDYILKYQMTPQDLALKAKRLLGEESSN